MKYGSDFSVLLKLYELGLILSFGNKFLRTATWLLSKSLSISPQKSPTWRNFSLDIVVIITLNCSTNPDGCALRSNDNEIPICLGRHNWIIVCFHPIVISAMALKDTIVSAMFRYRKFGHCLDKASMLSSWMSSWAMLSLRIVFVRFSHKYVIDLRHSFVQKSMRSVNFLYFYDEYFHCLVGEDVSPLLVCTIIDCGEVQRSYVV